MNWWRIVTKATFDLQQQTGLAYSFLGFLGTEIAAQGLNGRERLHLRQDISNTGGAFSQRCELLVKSRLAKVSRILPQARWTIWSRVKTVRRLVRSSQHFFHNQMELLSYGDAEITWYKCRQYWTMDVTHPSRAWQQGLWYGQGFPCVNYPPCIRGRSTTIAHDDDTDCSNERRARNPKTGKVEHVPADDV